MKDEIVIQLYETIDGKCPYLEWESKLTKLSRAKVSARLARIKLGNFGDCKSIQGVRGLYELRIHLGPGYRIYFGKTGKKVVLLLLGGDKTSQKKDIKKSCRFWEEYLSTP
ncbi:MAG: type II toxin-antitoxin system RelE/ParE family toxin [Chlamydiia bacterium]|nr:type II toxin-antitoxin system RelE/ParE family toxin [Chlamydiia bacterium]